jgi:exosortase A
VISGQEKLAWRNAGPLVVILLVLTLALYQQTVLYLADIWGQFDIGEYAHGYLVLAISGYLVIVSRERWLSLSPEPEYRALILVIAASLLWLVAALADVQMLQSVALLILLLGMFWVVLGNQVIRVLAFPILFIFFAIPIWFPLSPVLQDLAADSVFSIIRLLGVPAMRQDNMIILPAGRLSVEEACSGLRYLLAALTLGTLYAYMYYSSLRARLMVVLISAGSAVLANILRVFIVVYLGYATEMQHPLVDSHLSLGWYLFAGLVALLLVFDAFLHKEATKAEQEEVVKQHSVKMSGESKTYLKHYFVLVAGLGLVISAAPGVAYVAGQRVVEMAAHEAPELPPGVGGWASINNPDDTWMPVYHGAVTQKQFYSRNGDEAVLFMGYYAAQSQGKELINDLNHIANGDVWYTVYPKAQIKTAGRRVVLEQVLKNDAKKQRLVWYWYNIAGMTTTNRYEAKVLQVLGLLMGKPHAYVIAVAVRVDDNIDHARQILEDFVASIEVPTELAVVHR